MKAVIHRPTKKDKRIKFYIPFEAIEWRNQIKKLNTIWYHKNQQLWSVVNNEQLLNQLKQVFKDRCEYMDANTKKFIQPAMVLNELNLDRLAALEKQLLLKAYSISTIKNYKSCFAKFLVYFQKDVDSVTIEDLEKREIEDCLLYTSPSPRD